MKCYLCGAEPLQVIATVLREGPGVVYWCELCDLAALETDALDVDSYYRDEYRRLHGPVLGRPTSYREIFDAYVDLQATKVERLRPHLMPGARLLEVGSSAGQFLANVRPLVDEAIGVDLDDAAATFAADVTGCTTYGMPLGETPLEPHSFDVVVSIQTLEHVPDPRGFVDLLARYLKPEGLLFLEVPNLHDPLRSVWSSAAYERFFFHAAHLFYFSPRSLEKLLTAAGFAGTIEFVQDYNFTNHLHWALTESPQATSEPGLGPATLPLSADTPQAMRVGVDALLAEFDTRYRELLVQNGLTENIAYIGRAA